MIIDKIKIGNTTYNVGARYQDVSGTPTKTSDFTNDGDGTSNYATEDYVGLNGGKIDKIKVNNVEQTITNKEVNISVPTTTSDLTNDSGFIDKSVNNLDNYTPSSQTTTRLELVLDSSTFKIKGILKDSSNNVIYTSNEIDLPLETVVVDGTYDSLTKEIVLELVNGNTIRFSVSALVSGLISDTDLATALENYYTKGQVDNLLNAKQNTITSSNKLDSDLVDDTNSTNKFVTSAEKNAWNGKQDELTAGENITIVNNVISASGGSSTTKIYEIINTTNKQHFFNFNNRPLTFANESTTKPVFIEQLTTILQDIYDNQITQAIICLRDNNLTSPITGYGADFIGYINTRNIAEGYTISTFSTYFTRINSFNTGTQTPFLTIDCVQLSFGFRINDGVVSITNLTVSGGNDLLLSTNNTSIYTPVGDYNPATKKYVDSAISSAITDALGGSY